MHRRRIQRVRQVNEQEVNDERFAIRRHVVLFYMTQNEVLPLLRKAFSTIDLSLALFFIGGLIAGVMDGLRPEGLFLFSSPSFCRHLLRIILRCNRRLGRLVLLMTTLDIYRKGERKGWEFVRVCAGGKKRSCLN